MIMGEAEELFRRCISQSGSVALTRSKEDCHEAEVLAEVADVYEAFRTGFAKDVDYYDRQQ